MGPDATYPFSPQEISQEDADRLEDIRDEFRCMVRSLDALTEGGRYKSLMMTALETAAMWATKSVTHR